MPGMWRGNSLIHRPLVHTLRFYLTAVNIKIRKWPVNKAREEIMSHISLQERKYNMYSYRYPIGNTVCIGKAMWCTGLQ